MRLWLAAVLTLLLMGANIVTFGWIGDFLFTIGDGIANAVFGESRGAMHGDYYSPIAIWMGLVWPVGALLLFLGMFRGRRVQPRPMWVYPLFISCLLTLDVALSVAFRAGASYVSPEFEIEERTTIQ